MFYSNFYAADSISSRYADTKNNIVDNDYIKHGFLTRVDYGAPPGQNHTDYKTCITNLFCNFEH